MTELGERALAASFVPKRAHAVEASRVAGELVVLDAEGRTLRGFNTSAARAWELMDGRRSAEDIARVIAKEFAVSSARALQDLRAFLAALLARGLVEDAAP